MTENEEIIIYDCMIAVQDEAKKLVPLLTAHGTKDDVWNYKSAIYSVVIRLSTLFGPEQLARQKSRHEEIRRELEAYLAARQENEEKKP